MIRYRVEIADEAWNAIQTQVRYIALENKAPENAARWLNRLLMAVDSLEALPSRFVIDQAQSRAIGATIHRMVFEKTYLMYYTVDDRQRLVIVVSFRHGAREQKPLI